MSDSKNPKAIPRREFLKSAGLTTGAVGAAAVLSGVPAKAATMPEAGRKSAGYRETEHVLKYYELARL
ncbi:MAG: twin-arginine translocation signal domain-containing protein [Rhodospirillales bacterium]